MRKVKTDIIGCGNISAIYLKNLTQLFEVTQIVACADIAKDRAIARAEEFGIPKAYTVEQLLLDPDIDIVVNLTTPDAHAEINIAAIQSGKHVYCEKPLAICIHSQTRSKRMVANPSEPLLLRKQQRIRSCRYGIFGFDRKKTQGIRRTGISCA